MRLIKKRGNKTNQNKQKLEVGGGGRGGKGGGILKKSRWLGETQ